MTNLYKIKFNVEDKNVKLAEKFNLAFRDIHQLSTILCNSKNSVLIGFIASCVPDDPPWLSVTQDEVAIIA